MGVGEKSRKQPWRLEPLQPWASELVEASHTEALWTFGESCLYTLMWRVQDLNAGLVARCSVCWGRSSEAFKQTSDSHCPHCYGTTFEGGIRAQIIRPTIFADRNVERVDTARGTMDIDSPMLETTSDFFMTKGDFVFRADASRYQVEQKGEAMIVNGYGYPLRADSFRGSVSAAHLEDPTAVAFLIPPPGEDLAGMLGGPPVSEDLGVGEPLPPELTGLRSFEFVDQDLWVVDHMLGTLVPGTFEVTDLSNAGLLAQPDFATINQLVVRWPSPQSGRVWVRP